MGVRPVSKPRRNSIPPLQSSRTSKFRLYSCAALPYHQPHQVSLRSFEWPAQRSARHLPRDESVALEPHWYFCTATAFVMTAQIAEPVAKAARLDGSSANVVTVQLVSADGDKTGTRSLRPQSVCALQAGIPHQAAPLQALNYSCLKPPPGPSFKLY